MRSPRHNLLSITTSHRPQTIVMLLAGELDIATEDHLRAHMRAALTDHPRTLVLELSGLEFIDCTGLSIMIWARNALSNDNATLHIRNPRPAVRRVLAIGGLTRHLPDPAP